MTAPREVLTTAEVGRLLTMSPKNVRRLPIPYADLGPHTRRYLLKDVLAFLEARAQPFGLRKVG